MKSLRNSLVGIDGHRLDAVVAMALLVELELECWLDQGVSSLALTSTAAVLVIAPVAVRRRWPAAALVFSTTALMTQALLGGDLDATNGVSVLLALGLLAYSAGSQLDLRRGLVTLILAGASTIGFVSLTAPSASGGIGSALFVLGLVLATPWFVGRLSHARSRRAAAFSELATQAASEHAEHERAAIAQERVRLGVELQDIIAHSVSAMVVQAGGARRLLGSDPQRARDSILTVEQTGREALADMRRLLGMLRKDDDPQALAPQPGLNQLRTLIDSVHDNGLPCELHLEGEPIDLTPGIDLVGYRVIEATLRRVADHHSGGAVVTVRFRPEALELEIRGHGAMPGLEQELRGMSERVALYDGSLRELSTEDDEFALQARLPLEAMSPA
jgi:signal transduction histidine kinase